MFDMNYHLKRRYCDYNNFP